MTKISQNLDRVFSDASSNDWNVTLKKKFGGHSVVVSKGNTSTTCKINDLIADLQARTDNHSLTLDERKAYRDKINAAIAETNQSTGFIHRIRSSVGNARFGRKDKLRCIEAHIAIDDFISNRHASILTKLNDMEASLNSAVQNKDLLSQYHLECLNFSREIETIKKYLEEFPRDKSQDKANRKKLKQLQTSTQQVDHACFNLNIINNPHIIQWGLRALQGKNPQLHAKVEALLSHDIVINEGMKEISNLSKENFNEKKLDFDKQVEKYVALREAINENDLSIVNINDLSVELRLHLREKIAQGNQYIESAQTTFENAFEALENLEDLKKVEIAFTYLYEPGKEEELNRLQEMMQAEMKKLRRPKAEMVKKTILKRQFENFSKMQEDRMILRKATIESFPDEFQMLLHQEQEYAKRVIPLLFPDHASHMERLMIAMDHHEECKRVFLHQPNLNAARDVIAAWLEADRLCLGDRRSNFQIDQDFRDTLDEGRVPYVLLSIVLENPSLEKIKAAMPYLENSFVGVDCTLLRSELEALVRSKSQ